VGARYAVISCYRYATCETSADGRFVSWRCTWLFVELITVPESNHIAGRALTLHSIPQYSAEVKNAWTYTSTPTIRLHGIVPD